MKSKIMVSGKSYRLRKRLGLPQVERLIQIASESSDPDAKDTDPDQVERDREFLAIAVPELPFHLYSSLSADKRRQLVNQVSAHLQGFVDGYDETARQRLREGQSS